MTGDTMDAVAAANQPRSTRPMTGVEYLESLRDGREIWLYGERVADVTAHPSGACRRPWHAMPHRG